MEVQLKQRLIGAAVLGALAVIFLPMLLKGPEKPDPDAANVPLEMPAAPAQGFETRVIPLTGPIASTPENGVLGMTQPAEDTITPLPDAATGVTPAPVTSTEPVAVEASPDVIEPIASDEPAAVAIDAATGLPDESATPAAPTTTKPESKTDDSPLSVVAKPKPNPLPEPKPETEPVAQAPAAKPAITAPPPTPAAPRSVPGGAFAVNVGSFSNAANANELVARLRASGLPVFSETIQIDGKSAQRVRVGPYGDRPTAEAARLRTEQVSAAAASVVANEPAPAQPTTAAVPAPVAATRSAAADVGFAVQLGAFRDEAEALALRDRARTAGFAAFHQRVPVEQGWLYRVRLGPEADRPGAERLLANAAPKLGINNAMVVTHP